MLGQPLTNKTQEELHLLEAGSVLIADNHCAANQKTQNRILKTCDRACNVIKHKTKPCADRLRTHIAEPVKIDFKVVNTFVDSSKRC